MPHYFLTKYSHLRNLFSVPAENMDTNKDTTTATAAPPSDTAPAVPIRTHQSTAIVVLACLASLSIIMLGPHHAGTPAAAVLAPGGNPPMCPLRALSGARNILRVSARGGSRTMPAVSTCEESIPAQSRYSAPLWTHTAWATNQCIAMPLPLVPTLWLTCSPSQGTVGDPSGGAHGPLLDSDAAAWTTGGLPRSPSDRLPSALSEGTGGPETFDESQTAVAGRQDSTHVESGEPQRGEGGPVAGSPTYPPPRAPLLRARTRWGLG